MKLIRKYDLGGLMSFQPLPLVSAPVSQQQEEQPARSSKKQESVIDDDYMKKLVGKGITNDVMAYASKIDNAFAEYQSMSDAERNTIRGKTLRKIMSGNDLATTNALLRNQEMFAEGIKNVTDKNAQSSYAVTTNGVMAYNTETGEFEEVTVSDLSENKDKYRMLTNAELINQREVNPMLQGTTIPFVSLKNAVSIDNVRDYVFSYLNGIGTSSSKAEENRFTTSKDASIYNAIKDVADQVNGVYEEKVTMSKKSNKQQIDSALGAIFSSLPDNYKNFLKAEAISKGFQGEDIEKAVKSYIGLIAGSKSIDDNEALRSIGIVDIDKLSGSKGKSGSSKQDEMKFTQSVVSNNGAQVDDYTLNFGTSYNVKVAGANTFNGWQTDEGPVSKPTMLSDMPNIVTVGDMSQITLGDVNVDASKLSQIMYVPSTVVNARLFTKTDEKGNIQPDYDLTNRIEKANALIKKENAKGLMAQNIYRSNDIETIVENGKVIPVAPQREFVLLDVITNENVIDDKHNNALYKEEKSDAIKNDYDQNFKYTKGIASDSYKRGHDDYKGWFGSGSDLYRTKMAILKTGDVMSSTYADKGATNIDPYYNTIEGQMLANKVIGKETIVPIMEKPRTKVIPASKNALNK